MNKASQTGFSKIEYSNMETFDENDNLILIVKYKNKKIIMEQEVEGNNLKMITYFDNLSTMNGKMEAYKNGELISSMQIKNSIPEGEVKIFFPSGKLLSTFYIKNGTMDGTMKAFYENGKIRMIGHFKDGKKDGEFIEYDEDGNIIFTTIVKTDSMEGFEKTIQRLSKILLQQVKSFDLNFDDVQSVGVGVPGPVLNSRVVKFWANFPWKNGVDLALEFEKNLGKPVKADNDVNVITLGEMWKGSAQGYKNVLGLAIGTGIGGGIIVDGKLVSGENGAGGEVGHIKVERDGKLCGCGQKGCWEAYASATGLIREAQSRLAVNKTNGLYEQVIGRDLEAKDIFDVAKEGDAFALDLVDYEADYIALGIGNLLNVLDPEIVVVGGGVSLAGDILFDKVKERLKKYAFPSTTENLKIVAASLGNDAGILGAAYLGMM